MTDTGVASRVKTFREQLSRRVLVADGAMGTMLYDKGIFINRCYDELNLTSPDMIRQIHADYVKAGRGDPGDQYLRRQSHAAGGFRTGRKASGHQPGRRQDSRGKPARDTAFVAGAVGPLGANIEPLGPTSFAEARSIFREQVETLVEAGVDLLILETFYNLDELREAIFAAREVAGPEMVIVGQVTIDDYGNLRGGADTETFTRRLDEWPVDVIGANCSAGPKVMLETIEKMMLYSKKPMSAMPNAGHPQRVEGRNIYLCSPEYMSQYARRFLWAGVKIIGGCCGTTPEHIKLIRSEARSLQPGQAHIQTTVAEALGTEKPVQKMPKIAVKDKSQLGRQAGGGHVRRLRRDPAAARCGRFERDRRSRAVQGARHRLHQRARRPARQRPHELASHLPAHPAGGRDRGRQSLLLPRPEHSRDPVRAARRARGRRAQPDLHHRRSAAHGSEPERHGRVRRGRDRPGEHREQSESRARYQRQSDGIADRAAAGRGRESRGAEYGRRDSPLRAESGSGRRVRRNAARFRPRSSRALSSS